MAARQHDWSPNTKTEIQSTVRSFWRAPFLAYWHRCADRCCIAQNDRGAPTAKPEQGWRRTRDHQGAQYPVHCQSIRCSSVLDKGYEHLKEAYADSKKRTKATTPTIKNGLSRSMYCSVDDIVISRRERATAPTALLLNRYEPLFLKHQLPKYWKIQNFKWSEALSTQIIII